MERHKLWALLAKFEFFYNKNTILGRFLCTVAVQCAHCLQLNNMSAKHNKIILYNFLISKPKHYVTGTH